MLSMKLARFSSTRVECFYITKSTICYRFKLKIFINNSQLLIFVRMYLNQVSVTMVNINKMRPFDIYLYKILNEKAWIFFFFPYVKTKSSYTNRIKINKQNKFKQEENSWDIPTKHKIKHINWSFSAWRESIGFCYRGVMLSFSL